MNKYALSWIIRIVIAALFIVSAVAKLYPSPYFAISTFEVKQLYPLGFSEHIAPYFSRFLIGIEFALGILFLLPVKIRKVITPVSILLLAVFTIHLSYETFKTGGNAGNCGCFGSLLPMTPIEAIIKNIVAIGLLVGLLKLKIMETDKTKIWFLSTITLASILGLFMLAPIRPIEIPINSNDNVEINLLNIETNDTLFNANTKIDIDKEDVLNTKETEPKSDETKEVIKEVIDEPKASKSGFAKFYPDIDNGKKILCFFAPGCDHCQDTAKELTAMRKKDKNFPDVKIIFMNEEAYKIPEFFEIAQATYPYKIIEIIPFWNELGNERNTPGVMYLWNGNKIKIFDGIDANQFDGNTLEKMVKQPYSKIK
ncbi:MauE/DoxX family redox-associated membrane protein [Flavobacterium sp.]|uniref:MauE/DoxX family redox-associated membrane protein n=1 Tax=Flavobacterium sp. TaxID=239 RepID=UPI003F6A103E